MKKNETTTIQESSVTEQITVGTIALNGKSALETSATQFVFKQDAELDVMLAFNTERQLAEQNLLSAKKAYIDALPHVARIINNEYYKELSDTDMNKSANKFVKKWLGCSSGYASEMVAIVKTFYSNLGNINPAFEFFTPAQLYELSKQSDEVRNEIPTRYKKACEELKKDSLTSKEFEKWLKTEKAKMINDNNGVSVEDTKNTENTEDTEDTEGTENTKNTKDTKTTKEPIEPNYKEILKALTGYWIASTIAKNEETANKYKEKVEHGLNVLSLDFYNDDEIREMAKTLDKGSIEYPIIEQYIKKL